MPKLYTHEYKGYTKCGEESIDYRMPVARLIEAELGRIRKDGYTSTDQCGGSMKTISSFPRRRDDKQTSVYTHTHTSQQNTTSRNITVGIRVAAHEGFTGNTGEVMSD